jgi:hypothetical protein
LWDKNYKTQTKQHGLICQFWAGLTHTGETSVAVTEVTNHAFKNFGLPDKNISGCSGDSGAGTPQSCAKSLNSLGIWHHQHVAADLCGLHDLPSAFRPALHCCVGIGGPDLRNAIQLLHTMSALCMELKKGWKKTVGAVWKGLWHRSDARQLA